MTVICDMLGVPREDEPLFRQWGRTAVSTTLSKENVTVTKKVGKRGQPLARHHAFGLLDT
jgi:cytochrome P450